LGWGSWGGRAKKTKKEKESRRVEKRPEKMNETGEWWNDELSINVTIPDITIEWPFLVSALVSFMLTFNIRSSIWPSVCPRLRIMSSYTASKRTYMLLFARSSTYNLYSNKTSPLLKMVAVGGAEGYLLYPGLCTRFHRMVTANGPSPDTYILVFISAGSLYNSLHPFLSGWPSAQIAMHIAQCNCDYHVTKILNQPLLGLHL